MEDYLPAVSGFRALCTRYIACLQRSARFDSFSIFLDFGSFQPRFGGSDRCLRPWRHQNFAPAAVDSWI